MRAPNRPPTANNRTGPPEPGTRDGQRRPPPPGILAAAEQEYQVICRSVTTAMRGARLIAAQRGSEIEAYAEVYFAFSRSNPAVASAMGAPAITQLAMQPENRRTAHDRCATPTVLAAHTVSRQGGHLVYAVTSGDQPGQTHGSARGPPTTTKTWTHTSWWDKTMYLRFDSTTSDARKG